jgi:hypothetical protein
MPLRRLAELRSGEVDNPSWSYVGQQVPTINEETQISTGRAGMSPLTLAAHGTALPSFQTTQRSLTHSSTFRGSSGRATSFAELILQYFTHSP